MKGLMLVCLTVASTMAGADTPSKSCGKFSPEYELSRPLGINEIERYEMTKITAMLAVRSDIPKVPFGFLNSEWVSFKSRIRRGDKIVSYSADRRAWQNLAGETGYARMRSGCVIEQFTTMQN